MHPATTSISVKFRGIKEDTDISKRWTSLFCISYRSRDICLDCTSYINICDWMVKKITFTETIIHKWSSLSIQLTFYILWCFQICIFKTSGLLKLWFFVPIHCFTFCTTVSNHGTMFIFFNFLWSLFDLCTFTLAFQNLQISLVTDVPRVIIITSVLFWQSRVAYSSDLRQGSPH